MIRTLYTAAMCLFLQIGGAQEAYPPEGFVYLKDTLPSVMTEARYYSGKNFMGRPVKGYNAPRVILTEEAATALRHVQLELREKGLELKVFDAYRPQRAVDDFVAWAKDTGDTLRKSEYYPGVPKSELFKRDYIAARSSHSRGSTVDVTLVDLQTGKELDMGTPFDFFGPQSWPSSNEVTPEQKENRLLLQRVMKRHGFEPLETEWWHFTLRGEPYPEKYFDFEVR